MGLQLVFLLPLGVFGAMSDPRRGEAFFGAGFFFRVSFSDALGLIWEVCWGKFLVGAAGGVLGKHYGDWFTCFFFLARAFLRAFSRAFSRAFLTVVVVSRDTLFEARAFFNTCFFSSLR